MGIIDRLEFKEKLGGVERERKRQLVQSLTCPRFCLHFCVVFLKVRV